MGWTNMNSGGAGVIENGPGFCLVGGKRLFDKQMRFSSDRRTGDGGMGVGRGAHMQHGKICLRKHFPDI